MKLKAAKQATLVLSVNLGALACSQPPIPPAPKPGSEHATPPGIHPNLRAGNMPPADAATVNRWIEEAISVMQSPEFETNFQHASQIYPKLFVSQKEDLVPSDTVLARLRTQDKRKPNLWWSESFLTLTGTPATRSPDRQGFGFEASRKAGAGPMPGQDKIGRIELGRLHFARYTEGDVVEKSCALNTIVHEISHTLSDRPNQFWMHILDSEENVTAPRGHFEASYFIGAIAQCTYLESAGRITKAGFHDCLMTFSNPASGSRFKSLACDDFPDGKPITPQGRLIP